MKRKVIAALLSLSMIISTAAPVLAAEPVATERVTEMAAVGVGSKVPEVQSISLGREYSGKLDSHADVNYYTFTLSKAGKISFEFGNEDSTAVLDGWNVEIYNENNDAVLTRTYYCGGKISSNICEAGLSAGTYYVKVSTQDAGSWTSEAYSMRLNFTADNAWETEPNDSSSQANVLEPGETYYGSLSRVQDADYYTFTLPAPVTISLKFGSLEGALTGDSWNVELYNQSKELVMSQNFKRGTKPDANVCEIELPEGIYFVKVSTKDAGTWTSDGYSMQVDILTRYLMPTTVNGVEGWYCFVNNKVDLSYTGFIHYNDRWWYVRNGYLDFSWNGVEYGTIEDETAWWHVMGGRLVRDDTVAPNDFGWWYIRDGKVDFSYTGVAKNDYGWWRIAEGMVDFNCNGLIYTEQGWWYIKGGQIDFSYTGLCQNEYGWWRIVQGTVDFDCNGIVNSEYGWWYVQGGQINFDYTGLAENELGLWYIEKGKLDFTYNGYFTWYGVKYRIQGGKVVS